MVAVAVSVLKVSVLVLRGVTTTYHRSGEGAVPIRVQTTVRGGGQKSNGRRVTAVVRSVDTAYGP